MALLALGGEALLGDERLGLDDLGLAVGVLAAEDHLEAGIDILRQADKAGTASLGDEENGRIVALGKAETLDIEGLDTGVPVEGREGLVRVELLDEEDVALVFVDHVVARRVVGTVLEDRKDLVVAAELAEVFAAAVLVEALDVRVVPDILAADGGDALGLHDDLLDGILRHEVAAGRLALDGEGREIVLELRLLELRLRAEVDADGLGLAVVVDGEPEDGGAGRTGRDVVLLVAGHGGDGEALGVVDRALAVAVDDVVDGPLVAAVEHAHIQEVRAEEGLVADLGDAVLAVLADDDNLGEVGAFADEHAAVGCLQADADKALLHVGVELGVVVDHLRRGDGLKGGDFGLAREVLAVFLLQGLEPLDGVVGDVVQLVLDGLHLGLDGVNLLVEGLGVELGDLADRLLHEAVDVVHRDRAVQQVLVLLHLREDVVELLLPGALVLLEDLVDAVLEEDALERIPVPLVLQLAELDFELAAQDVAGVVGVVLEDVVHGEELRLAVLDDAGVRGDGGLAVREGVEGVDGLVRGYVVGEVDDDLDLLRGHVLDLLDLDLALFAGLQDGVDQHVGGLPVGDFRDVDRVLVDLLDLGADLDDAAALAGVVLAAVGVAAGREVGIELIRLLPQDGDGGVEKLVEVVRENLGGHTDGDAFRALREQERETHRELGRLLVAAVVGGHPAGDLRVEDHFLGEFRQAGLDVTRGGVGVAGQDVTPVTLAVHQEALLADGDEGAEDGGVAVGVVLHRLADDVRDLGVVAVVHLVHGVQHAALDRLEAVHDVRHRTVEDDVGRVIQEPVLEHAGELVLPAVAAQQLGELSAGDGRTLVQGHLLLNGHPFFVFLFRGNVIPLLTHISVLLFILHIRTGGAPGGSCASPGPPSQTWRGRPSSGRNPPSPAGPRSRLS